MIPLHLVMPYNNPKHNNYEWFPYIYYWLTIIQNMITINDSYYIIIINDSLTFIIDLISQNMITINDSYYIIIINDSLTFSIALQ